MVEQDECLVRELLGDPPRGLAQSSDSPYPHACPHKNGGTSGFTALTVIKTW